MSYNGNIYTNYNNHAETVMTQRYWEENYKANYINRRMHRALRKAAHTLPIVLGMCFLVGAFLWAGTEDFQTETGMRQVPATLCTENGIQYVVTRDGHMFEVSNVDLEDGKVEVLFDMNNTEDIADDIVVEIK